MRLISDCGPDGRALAAATGDAVGKCAGGGIGQEDEHRAEDESRGWMNVIEDEELRDKVEKDSDSDEVAHGDDSAVQELRTMLAMEDETPEEWGCSFARVFDAVA